MAERSSATLEYESQGTGEPVALVHLSLCAGADEQDD
jgi:hypothetical protein